MRESVGKKRQETGRSNISQCGNHQYGENFLGNNGLPDTRNQIRNGDRSFPEKLFH